MRSILAALLVTVAACGTNGPDTVGDDAEPDGGDADAPDGPDGGADVDSEPPDAGQELPEGASCSIFATECAAGLTCRIVDIWGAGSCGAVGELAAGDSCQAPFFAQTSPCGPAMACYNEPSSACYVLCDVDDPEARCAAGQSCDVVVPDTNIGLCN